MHLERKELGGHGVAHRGRDDLASGLCDMFDVDQLCVIFRRVAVQSEREELLNLTI